jgi:hypothetical protein
MARSAAARLAFQNSTHGGTSNRKHINKVMAEVWG